MCKETRNRNTHAHNVFNTKKCANIAFVGFIFFSRSNSWPICSLFGIGKIYEIDLKQMEFCKKKMNVSLSSVHSEWIYLDMNSFICSIAMWLRLLIRFTSLFCAFSLVLILILIVWGIVWKKRIYSFFQLGYEQNEAYKFTTFRQTIGTMQKSTHFYR